MIHIIIEILEKILSDRPNRKILIEQCQELIWNADGPADILKNLAYDLDFYEPDHALRKENHSYYDEHDLEKEITITIQKLKELNSDNL